MTSAVPPLAAIFSAADFEKWWRLDGQLLGQLAVAEDADAVGRAFAQASSCSASGSTTSPSLKTVSRSPTLTTWYGLSQVAWLKPLGHAAEQGIWPPSKSAGMLLPAGWPTGPCGRGWRSCRGRSRLPRPTRLFWCLDALVYIVQVHYSVTPRSRPTSSRVRIAARPSMGALTRLIGLVLP